LTNQMIDVGRFSIPNRCWILSGTSPSDRPMLLHANIVNRTRAQRQIDRQTDRQTDRQRPSGYIRTP
jgi:hypothetical protein